MVASVMSPVFDRSGLAIPDVSLSERRIPCCNRHNIITLGQFDPSFLLIEWRRSGLGLQFCGRKTEIRHGSSPHPNRDTALV